MTASYPLPVVGCLFAALALPAGAAELISSDGAAQDNFGFSTRLAGSIGLVGAYGADIGGSADQGAAYVFRDLDTVTGTVTRNAKLTASDGAAGTDFDGVSVGGNINVSNTNTVFRVILGPAVLAYIQNAGNAFWNTPNITQVWNRSAIFGKAFSSGAFQSVQTSEDVSGYGSFSITGTALTWTAVPELSNLLAAGLLGSGLLRRRWTVV